MADFTGIKPPRATPRRLRYDLLAQRLALLGLVIGVWWIYSLGEPHFKFPGPPRVYEAFKLILGNGDLWRNLAITLERVSIGFLLATIVSVPFGIMESQKFLEKEGLDVEWVKFSDVNQPLRAVALQTIDLAFAAPSAGAMAVIAEGAPIKIVLNTHIAEVYFVVLDDSPIKSLADIKGKKIGMHDGEMTVFSAGRYVDEIVLEKEAALLQKRLVVTDSARFDTLVVIPI